MNETRPEPRPAASRTRSRRMLGVPELDLARVSGGPTTASLRMGWTRFASRYRPAASR